jgi:hypothetical protein
VDFSNCKHLERIGDYAFADCHALERVTIPSTVNHLNRTTFCRNNGMPLDFIGVEGPMPLPLAIRLSVAYPSKLDPYNYFGSIALPLFFSKNSTI